MPFILGPTGKLLVGAGGLLLPECCCCDCTITLNRPTADFSYTQTAGDTDDCTISLTDESLPGDCGPITSWAWSKNGTPFSTSQNPTGVSVVDGDDITLEVTNAGGCTDSAVVEVQCGALCQYCTNGLPDTVTVVISGCVGFLAWANGTHTLTLALSECQWTKVVEPNLKTITASVANTYYQVRAGNPTTFYRNSGLANPRHCSGSHVLPFDSSGSADGVAATVTLTI